MQHVLFVFIAQLAYVIMSMFWTEQIDTFRTTTSNATSTGTEIKLKPLKSAPTKSKVPAQDPISTKYLVREMKPIACPFQASTSCLAFSSLWPCQASSTWTSCPRTSLRPKDRVLCSSKLGGPDAKQWLGECEIISTISGNSGGYRVTWLWHENTDFDIKSEHASIDEKDIRYVIVKDGTCLHQDPKWRSALEIVVRSPLYPPASRPPPSTLSW
jgi:hypothetical protein